ncbi:MAG: hypothetical protein K1X53_05895 [Candidatus Sumerlaeaceae bacterium]|nr:hypothetical protein [Candidatus Sumerlaeaceae bacterium]
MTSDPAKTDVVLECEAKPFLREAPQPRSLNPLLVLGGLFFGLIILVKMGFGLVGLLASILKNPKLLIAAAVGGALIYYYRRSRRKAVAAAK